MRRWALRIFVFLILGAIVNVAVAWGCAFSNDLDADWPNVEAASTGEWSFVFVDRRFGSEEVRCCHRLSDAVDIERLPCHPKSPWWEEWHDRFGPFGTGEWGTAHGWPRYSMSAWRAWDKNPRRTERDEDYMTYGGWELSERNKLRLVPYSPIWPGFAINTVFYAGSLWLLFTAPFALQRRRRIRRGLCRKCAYPVGTSDFCTECGAAVKRSAKIVR